MLRYTNRELIDMHFVCGRADANARAHERLYRERFRYRDVPDHRLFSQDDHKLCEYGSLGDNKHSEGRARVTHGRTIEQ